MPRDLQGLTSRFALDTHNVKVEVQTFSGRAETIPMPSFVRKAILTEKKTGKVYTTLLKPGDNTIWYAGQTIVSPARIACLQRTADHLQLLSEERWRRRDFA